jgi:uncharacterized SAM-binding protein YcdF (DUF218 family)
MTQGRWPRLRSRWMRRALAALVVLFVIFCAVTARLFIWPATGMPARVDAIVVPGGTGNRLNAAIALARQGRARYLVLSHGMPVPQSMCGVHFGPALSICIWPDPDTTQGEAEATGKLAKEYGWHSIVLVTTPDQTWRAELRFRRCFSGSVYGVTTRLPLRQWPTQVAYQWAATLKAEVVDRSC